MKGRKRSSSPRMGIATQSASPSDITAAVAEQIPSMARYSAGVLLTEIEKSDFPTNEVRCVKARHPHWAGSLLLQKTLLKNLRPEVQAVTLMSADLLHSRLRKRWRACGSSTSCLPQSTMRPCSITKNLIAVGQGRKPVGDDDHRPPAGNALQVGLVH